MFIWFLFIALMFLILFYSYIIPSYITTQKFYPVEAQIVNIGIQRSNARKSPNLFTPKITYQYTKNDLIYLNDKYIRTLLYRDKNYIDSIVDNYKIGQKITIYCNKFDIKDCVIIKDFPLKDIQIFLFFLPFILFGFMALSISNKEQSKSKHYGYLFFSSLIINALGFFLNISGAIYFFIFIAFIILFLRNFLPFNTEKNI